MGPILDYYKEPHHTLGLGSITIMKIIPTFVSCVKQLLPLGDLVEITKIRFVG